MTRKRRAVFAAATALALALTLTGTKPALGQTEGSGDERRRPVTLGLIEQREGAFVTPEFGTAVEAMVAYFNAERSGVGGRRMAVEVCTTDDTPASAVACAEHFAAADDVHLVIESTTNPFAIADVLEAAGKPLLAGGVDLRNMLRRGTFVMEPGTAGIAHALFSYAASNVDVSHLTIFHADDPAIAAARPVLDFIAASIGITVDAYVPLGFTGDLTAPISAGMADQSDGLVFVIAPNQCAPVADALGTLGNDLPVLVGELCLTDDFVRSGAADGWYAGQQSVAPVVNGGKEGQSIRRILRTYGPNAERGGFAGLGVGYAWIARDVLALAGAGGATDQSVLRALSTYSSSGVLGFDQVSCPGPGPFAAACNASTLIVQVEDGQLYDVGGFVRTDFSIFEDLLGGP
jgi:ABC-type branched-subunit amino acid transport system substrate-binding protein